MRKINSPAGEGSAIVPRYNYATGEYMNPNYYGENTGRHTSDMSGLDAEINNMNTRMGRKGYAPVPNYMIGTGNSPMSRGGNNLFPSQQQGFEYLTSGGYPPPSAMPQNANVYPAMFNHQTGERIDPQSGGLVPYEPMVDKHSSSLELCDPMFGGTPDYLKPQHDLGSTMPYRDVNGSGGYRYRQFADGSIQILAGKQGIGTMVYKSSPYWKLITDEIGAYPTSSAIPTTGREGLDQILQSEQAKGAFMSLFDRFVTGQGSKTEQLELARQQALLEQQKIKEQMQPSFFEKSKPYLIGLTVIGVVGSIAYVATKK